jgi:hypothetical protein
MRGAVICQITARNGRRLTPHLHKHAPQKAHLTLCDALVGPRSLTEHMFASTRSAAAARCSLLLPTRTPSRTHVPHSSTTSTSTPAAAMAASSALLHGGTFFLETFALRQWDDPGYSGTRLAFDKAQFVARVHEHFEAAGGQLVRVAQGNPPPPPPAPRPPRLARQLHLCVAAPKPARVCWHTLLCRCR